MINVKQGILLAQDAMLLLVFVSLLLVQLYPSNDVLLRAGKT